jgi:acyl-coenzyme A synthetase/AMP-(fatty) acid ligase
VVHLLIKASCHHLIVTSATLPTRLVDAVEQEPRSHHPTHSMQVAEMPSPSYMCPNFWGVTASDSLYPSPSQSSSPDHVALYLHSSGSTGLPKVVPHTNRTTCSWAAFSMFTIMIHTHSYHLLAAFSAGKGLAIHAPHRCATMALPPAHGLFGNTILGIYCGLTMGL